MSDLEFKECDKCSSKPGSPILCDGCLNNRHVISVLQIELKLYTDIVRKLVGNV